MNVQQQNKTNNTNTHEIYDNKPSTHNEHTTKQQGKINTDNMSNTTTNARNAQQYQDNTTPKT